MRTIASPNLFIHNLKRASFADRSEKEVPKMVYPRVLWVKMAKLLYREYVKLVCSVVSVAFVCDRRIVSKSKRLTLT
jgi:hypothetical protein